MRRWSKRRRRRRKRRCLRIRYDPVHEGMCDLGTLGLLGHSDFQQNLEKKTNFLEIYHVIKLLVLRPDLREPCTKSLI